MSISDEAQKLQRDAIKLARDYGYITGTDGTMYAPLGKFEGEPFYTLFYYEGMLNGSSEQYGDTDHDNAFDVFDVTPDERAAFGFGDEITHVALYTSNTGFVTLTTWTKDDHEEAMAELLDDATDEADFDELDDSDDESNS